MKEVVRSTLTTKEAAEYLGISVDMVFKMVREKRIPHFRVGRRILFRVSSIDEWIEQQECKGIV